MPNDILAKWSPEIDSSRFNQGDISEEVWRKFREFVALCHASKHYKALADDDKRSTRIIGLRKHEIEQYRSSSKQSTTLHFRAKFLAMELCHQMARLANSMADQQLVLQILERTQLNINDPVRGHELANFYVMALDEYVSPKL